jgi:site-specific DNA-cytosine methylase
VVYGSVCSGISSESVAWKPLGWSPAWFSETAPFPSAVLAHHYPRIPKLTFQNMREVLRIIALGTHADLPSGRPDSIEAGQTKSGLRAPKEDGDR